jgi:cytidylate kinase
MSVGHHIVAIDGPAASGKSSVARELARRLGFIYVNSGAMYRAITWFVLNKGIDPNATGKIVELVDCVAIESILTDNELRIHVNGSDSTPHLRDDNVNTAVSRISTVPRVRELLSAEMRNYAREHNLVTEGRDIGSVVFPDTPFKFYIDASPDVRSRRRAAQGEQDVISLRDKADSSRATAPLMIAKDAGVIDTSQMTITQVVDEIVRRLRQKGFSATQEVSSRAAETAGDPC